ncbi:hypothetical protein [Mesorhizobium sp. SP-1A]|uniref:hypothetical protein n=1 Tax=Mesorhizobium sp. SP-1A TaxID=3077840 RepID=UPI0028F71026|nr:hypothetical protein [Mesorhizobium sp. SP-1A]
MRTGRIWDCLARAIAATGTAEHVDRLIDLIGADIAHDLVTVTRYSATRMPEFVKHRRFSDEMVRRYLENYYVFDPFYACWRREQRLGIVPLRTLADDEVKRGQYIAEFLAQSRICDEVGILLADGGDWCLGIFLDRTEKPFRDSELALLTERLPVFASLHALDIRANWIKAGTLADQKTELGAGQYIEPVPGDVSLAAEGRSQACYGGVDHVSQDTDCSFDIQRFQRSCVRGNRILGRKGCDHKEVRGCRQEARRNQDDERRKEGVRKQGGR